jgi:predicted dehydrogenase
MTSPATPLGVGIIGCGNISSAYLRLAPLFGAIEMRAVADLDPRVAEARAAEFGLRAATVEALLAADDIDIVVNLTIPAAHFDVSAAIIAAGKHVYSEKPFVLSVADGQELAGMAAARGLRIGSAPDTFLGGAHQQARHIVDEGQIGRVVGGTAYVMSHGMEHWHPNPSFFFQPGAGPVLDVGPYYVTNLIQLIGPVRRVAAITATPARQREILSAPLKGQMIEVNTPTTLMSVLEFASGAVVTLAASWDVWAHGHAPMELYGTDGSLFVPDPNFFGGELRASGRDGKAATVAPWAHPFGVLNETGGAVPRANYRAAGLADMADAIRTGRPHRCSLEMSLHAVEVMTAILRSGETGAFVELTTTCDRPAALPAEAARALLAAQPAGIPA